MGKKVIEDLKFEIKKNENDQKKRKSKKKRKRVTSQIDLSTIEQTHYELYYSGPSESRSRKIEQ